MIKGDYERLTNLAKFNVCAEHKTPLEVAWYGQEHTWVLRCGHDHFPDSVTRQLSLTEEYKAGEEIPEPILSNIKKGEKKRAMQHDKQSTAITFAGVPATDLGTGELITREQVEALVQYAYRYKLDPARGHVVLMYGKPYFTIDGYLFHAHLSHKPYSLESRPMTTDEAKNYKISETDHAWICELRFLDTSQLFTGLGIVTYDEMTEESKKKPSQLRSPVVAAHPWQLGQKRAEWQALRRAFPIGESEEETHASQSKTQEASTLED